MVRRRSDIDWYSVFLSYYSHDGATDASSDSLAPAPQASMSLDSHQRTEELRSVSERRFGGHSTGAQVDDGAHIQITHTEAKLPLNKRKRQGHGGKRKPSVNKRRPHATDPEESDYESPLPSRFSKRRKQQLQNSSSIHSQKVHDVVLLDDEDVEPKEEVNREMSDRLNEPKIYYPSRDDQEAVELTRSDIKCLDPEVFLSSPVINFYIKYIKRTRLCNENFRDRFYIFNTYFFGKLEEALYQPHQFPKLRRWWKGVNIFNNAYIILPIHAKEHWSLVIICLPPKERISEPIVLHLDSLGMHCSAKILNTVGRYLEKEWHFLSVAEPAWPCLQSDIRKETVQVPQQNNAYDCGVFMLYYIEQFIKEAPARFRTDKLGMFNCNWFKPEEASSLRQRIRELLLEEFESARMYHALSKADAPEGFDDTKDWGLEADDSSKMAVVVGDAAKSIKGIGVAELVEASVEFGVTGKNKSIRVLASEYGYPAKSIEDIADVAVINKGPTSSNKACVISEATSSPDSVKDKKGTVKTDSSKSKAEKEGKSIVLALPKIMKGTEEVMGSMPFPDLVIDSGDKRSEGVIPTSSNKACVISEATSCPDSVKHKKGIVKTDSGKSKAEKEGKSILLALPKRMKGTEEVMGSMPFPDLVFDSGVKRSEGVIPTSSNKACIISEATSCPDSVKDKKGTVKTDSGKSKAEKEGKSILLALPKRMKGTEEVMGSMPFPDLVIDSGVKRSDGVIPTSSNKACIISEATSCPDSVKDKKGTVKTDSGKSKAEKEGKSIVFALPKRMKGTEEVMGSMPFPDLVIDSGVKRSDGVIPTSSNKACIISEATSCPDSVKDKKGTVKTDSGKSKAEKEGKSTVLASPKRMKGTEEVTGTMPIPDLVIDSGVKRSEGFTGSMPLPDAVCEITGSKVWITRVYRPPITLPLENRCPSSDVSSRNARRAFTEHFSQK